MNNLLAAILSGGVAVAVIEGIKEALAWRRNRKAAKEDKAEQKKEDAEKQASLRTEERLQAIEAKTDAQSEAIKYILYDRIRYLGQAYIDEGEIDFDDRRILNDMHRSYHSGLGGNGDLDVLMREVNNLRLKKR